MSKPVFLNSAFHVASPDVVYSEEEIEAKYGYRSTLVTDEGLAVPKEEAYIFSTQRKVPRTGLMLVGWGGNNGSTLTASIIANKHNISWSTKEGTRKPDYVGSLTQSSTVRVGLNSNGASVYCPFKYLLPMLDPNDIEISGWDISGANMYEAMSRAKVLDYDLQRQLSGYLEDLKPLPSIYSPNFIAANQCDRADNIVEGTKQQHLDTIRKNIRDFKAAKRLDKVVVLWTANTERFCSIVEGINTTSAELLESIARGEAEISPSTIFAVASILEGCSYINGSPQNTFVPGAVELASKHNVFIVGDDFKSGQTKMKSVLVDYLVSAGIKPVSIVSYNHLGNNDGRNLSSPEQFRSKEISKSNVVDDMVDSNRILYKDGEHPDHCVVIKYVPYVGDSKRAMDEYTSEIFMGGRNTITMHNVCEDSLLATPIILDLVILCELCERITIRRGLDGSPERFHPVLSLLSYLLKAPLVPPGTPIVNALSAQRQALVNVFRACVGLAPENHMLLEHRLASHVEVYSHAQSSSSLRVDVASVSPVVQDEDTPPPDSAAASKAVEEKTTLYAPSINVGKHKLRAGQDEIVMATAKRSRVNGHNH